MVISYLLEKSAKQEDKNYEDILEVLRNTPTEDLIKYSFSYPKQKSDIDIAVEAANDIVKLYKDEENKRKKIEKQMDRLIACVKEYSSDITYNQILMASGILGFEDPTFLNEESDKVVRSNYEKVKKN